MDPWKMRAMKEIEKAVEALVSGQGFSAVIRLASAIRELASEGGEL
jgi:hypothetical protein